MTENMKESIDVTQIPQEFVWANAWGGATRSTTPPMIHAKVRELRAHVGSVEAKKANGVMFPVRGAKELMQKLAQACHDCNVTVACIQQVPHYYDASQIPDNKTSSGKPVFRTLVHVIATVRIAAEDGSFIDVQGSGHGGDVDDKAGGKASTYAVKDALFKGLMIPDKDIVDTDDEQPSERAEKPRATKTKDPAPDTGGSGILEMIAAAKSTADLDAIKAKVKNKEIELVGAERLRAADAIANKQKELGAA